MAKTLPPLKRSEVDTAAKIMVALQQSGGATEQRLRDYLRRQGIETKAKQDEAFRLLAGMHKELAGQIDAILAEGVAKAAGIGHEEAAKAIGGEPVGGKLLQYDPKRTAKYLSLITPENGRGLAAVFTDKMTEKAVKDLRRITVDVFRRADLEALTANQRIKELQTAWASAAGDLNGFRFTDSSGKDWENSRYLQMLVRTTQARVHREAFADTIVENGDDLVRIVEHGDNCPTCQAWDGIIISISGTNDKFPSYAEALDAGWAHPSCDGTLERIDETVDAADVKKQGETKTPSDTSDLEAMKEYHKEAGLPESQDDRIKTDFADEAMRRYKERMARKSA